MKKFCNILFLNLSMKNFISFFIFFVFCGLASAQQKDIPILKYEMLEDKINIEKPKLVIVNFWSTTCAPCVKELPDFMEVHSKYRDNPNYKMLLVSLDRPKDIARVQKFIIEKNISAEVVILDDIKRMNTWIPRYDKDWQGEIPVTVFYNNGDKVHFNNGEMSKEDLENTITKYLN